MPCAGAADDLPTTGYTSHGETKVMRSRGNAKPLATRPDLLTLWRDKVEIGIERLAALRMGVLRLKDELDIAVDRLRRLMHLHNLIVRLTPLANATKLVDEAHDSVSVLYLT